LYLMDAVQSGTAAFDRTVIDHLDSCLGCLACESACPSGVRYGSRIEGFRSRIRLADPRFSYRARRFLARAGGNAKALRFIRGLASALDLVGLEGFRRRLGAFGLIPRPTSVPAREVVRALGPPRIRVALLVGCVAEQLRASITSSAVNVLRRNGVEGVLLPRDACCGALDLHAGNADAATRSATAMSRAVAESDVDYVVTTAAGCGAMLRRYGHSFGNNDIGADTSSTVADRARDVCELLVEVGFRPPRVRAPDKRTIAYHDACHLLHGCGVERAPREVLSAAGVRWFDLGENAICCGSAGVYNLTHPRAARDLARRKMDLLAETGASDVAVGNIGCIMQFERALSRAGRKDVGVWHPVELLEAAYRREALG